MTLNGTLLNRKFPWANWFYLPEVTLMQAMLQWTQAMTSILMTWCLNRGLYGSVSLHIVHTGPFPLTHTLTWSSLGEVKNSWPDRFSLLSLPIPPQQKHKHTEVPRARRIKWKQSMCKVGWDGLCLKNSYFMPSQLGIQFYKEREREVK